MLFSVYYKIEHRSEYLDKIIEKSVKELGNNSEENILSDRFTELMELMVNMLLNKDKLGLYNILTNKNSKVARKFFNYLTCSNIRSINKEVIRDRINEILKEG